MVQNDSSQIYFSRCEKTGQGATSKSERGQSLKVLTEILLLVRTGLEESADILAFGGSGLMEPGEHVADVTLRIVGVPLDGARCPAYKK